MKSQFAAGAVLAFFVFAHQAPANAAPCNAITTAHELQAVHNNLSASYCLKNDLDLGSIANFTPLAVGGNAFTGSFDGGGHVIRNLKMNRADLDDVGLFGRLQNATVEDFTLENIAVASTKANKRLGALAGTANGSTLISDVHIRSGQVAFNAVGGSIGGLVGALEDTASIEKSSSAAQVSALAAGEAGGLVSFVTAGTSIKTSYATGRVFCADGCDAGGLATGLAAGASIRNSFATGEVVCGGSNGQCGGAISSSSGTVAFVHASGTVLTGTNSIAGGLIGVADGTSGGTVDQSYSVGLIAGQPATAGGLIGMASGGPVVTNSYWDTTTSGQMTSAGGTGLRTRQFQANMPAGFNTTVWGINLKYSYPYLKSAALDFKPALATDVHENIIFAMMPISELDKSNYKKTTNHADQASLANCYTMIARAVGYGIDDGNLQDVKTDKYFWVDKTQKTTWAGPVTQYATLGTIKSISNGASLNHNVIAQMKKRNLVLLRGTYTSGKTTAESWMLGTLFSAEEDGTPIAVYANDPFTGQQVQIDPDTKMVVSPKKYPLKNFTVDGYQSVTINIVP